ncbi:MAG: hypothetical protein GVY12_12425 [Bacteroidetes bacterium]|jgi:hypothetical protein|nr:hypothetical protein [Bacteroidota bacterium]
MGHRTSEQARLLAHRKTHLAIIFSVLGVFAVYLAYVIYAWLAVDTSIDPILAIGLVVLVAGMIPSAMQLSTIGRELKRLG